MLACQLKRWIAQSGWEYQRSLFDLWPLTHWCIATQRGPHWNCVNSGCRTLTTVYNLMSILWWKVIPSLSVSLRLPRCPCVLTRCLMLLYIFIELSPCVSSLWDVFSCVPYSQCLPLVVVSLFGSYPFLYLQFRSFPNCGAAACTCLYETHLLLAVAKNSFCYLSVVRPFKPVFHGWDNDVDNRLR